MAIKYGGQDLQRRLYNGQNISRVIINGSQIRPTSQQHVNYHIVSDWTNSGGEGGSGLPSGWVNNGGVIGSGGVSNGGSGVAINQQYQGLPSLKNAYKIEIVYKFEWDQSTIQMPFDATLLRSNTREYQTQLVDGWDQILGLSSDNTASLSGLTAGTYTITTTLELNNLEATQVMTGPNGFTSSVSTYTISTTERSNIRDCNAFIVYLNNGVTLSSVDFYIYNNLPITHSDMQGPAPDGFHVPSTDEWVALCEILTNTFSLASTGATMKTYLLMPFAGNRYYSTAGVGYQGSFGYYWSSTGFLFDRARYLSLGSSILNPQNASHRSYGFSVRCFKDSPVIPDSSWATLYDGSTVTTGAGVFHNSSLGLISISGDGTTWYTIMDKNLGATSTDTTSTDSYGYYYQWGNNYGFPTTGNVTTSSTQVDASGYGPGNYYSSGTFIIRSNDWSSVQNDNLWGGVTQGTWES